MMRKLGLIACTVTWSSLRPALAEECAAIRDADRRNACLGETRSATDCEAIRDGHRRAACRAAERR